MRTDSHLRLFIREQAEKLALQLKVWDEQPKLDQSEAELVSNRIRSFKHTTYREKVNIAGVHASGDFPSVSYGNSFVYFTTAQNSLYTVDSVSKLKEVKTDTQPLALVSWIPEETRPRRLEFEKALEYLASLSVFDVIERSDYRFLKTAESRKANTIDILWRELIYPRASDTGNIGIQLRTTAEFGHSLQIIEKQENINYVLIDTTLSLPMVSFPTGSLFYEHLKRLCCSESRKRGIAFLGLSKAHGFPSVEVIENIAREKFTRGNSIAEHWYLRLPIPNIDHWKLSLAESRRVPPPGVVSYLVRFHQTFPVMRLDMDREFWRQQIHGKTESETQLNECRIFEDLDYSCHDQRCYGYPYPLKSAQDRATLTKSERTALRKQIIDAAVRVGMKRSQFREIAQTTNIDRKE